MAGTGSTESASREPTRLQLVCHIRTLWKPRGTGMLANGSVRARLTKSRRSAWRAASAKGRLSWHSKQNPGGRRPCQPSQSHRVSKVSSCAFASESGSWRPPMVPSRPSSLSARR